MLTTRESPDNSTYSTTLVLMAGLLAVALWSSVPVANKLALGYMDALSAAMLRSLIAGLLGLLIALSTRLPLPENAHEWHLLIVSGFTAFIAAPLLLSIGLTRTSVCHTALIAALSPIFTVLLGALVEKRRLQKGWWFGASMALIGTTVLITTQHASSAHEDCSLLGDLIMLTGACCCATGCAA